MIFILSCFYIYIYFPSRHSCVSSVLTLAVKNEKEHKIDRDDVKMKINLFFTVDLIQNEQERGGGERLDSLLLDEDPMADKFVLKLRFDDLLQFTFHLD